MNESEGHTAMVTYLCPHLVFMYISCKGLR